VSTIEAICFLNSLQCDYMKKKKKKKNFWKKKKKRSGHGTAMVLLDSLKYNYISSQIVLNWVNFIKLLKT